MLLVAITQRVMTLSGRTERRDTLDQAWTPFLEACGLKPLIIPNSMDDPAGFMNHMDVKGVILTGGNNLSAAVTTLAGQPASHLPPMDDLAPERDLTESALLRSSIGQKLPVMAVCRGMQMLNVFHGGRIRAIQGHASQKHAIVRSAEVADPKRFVFNANVNSFHDFGMSPADVVPELEILACAGDSVEAVAHRNYPHLGIMWHPERNTPFSGNDINLFRNLFGGSP
jgi:gamma-glutamyl-gamma-aminobutyrate hydrolase PuuD